MFKIVQYLTDCKRKKSMMEKTKGKANCPHLETSANALRATACIVVSTEDCGRIEMQEEELGLNMIETAF